MHILIIIIGLIIGAILNSVIALISSDINKGKRQTTITLNQSFYNKGKVLIPVICCLAFEIIFLRFGFTIMLVKAIVMFILLLIISVIDFRYRIIPNFMVAITLAIGIIFSLLVRASFFDIILGMLAGGGILFLLALVPNAMGGGDIKLMFAIGAFLGFNRTLWALLVAFILCSLLSIALILTKIKGTKDYIPFGPFLSVGSFISLLFFI